MIFDLERTNGHSGERHNSDKVLVEFSDNYFGGSKNGSKNVSNQAPGRRLILRDQIRSRMKMSE